MLLMLLMLLLSRRLTRVYTYRRREECCLDTLESTLFTTRVSRLVFVGSLCCMDGAADLYEAAMLSIDSVSSLDAFGLEYEP
jgi:hypothetical protein